MWLSLHIFLKKSKTSGIDISIFIFLTEIIGNLFLKFYTMSIHNPPTTQQGK